MSATRSLRRSASAAGLVGEQSLCVVRFEILAQQYDVGLRPAFPDLSGGDEPLVRVGRRHADVDDGDFWQRSTDEGEELGDVGGPPATSTPSSVSNRARPERMSMTSSAITTRTGSPP